MLVTFGVVRGLLRRVHKYAVRMAAPDVASPLHPPLCRDLADPRSYDELCTVFGVSAHDLDAHLATDPAVHVYMR